MKRVMTVTVTLLIVAFFVTYVSAQGIVAKGFKGGLNLANVSGDDVEDTDSRLGFAIGGFVTYSVNKQFSLQPEIYYTSKGFKLKEKGSESDVDYEVSYSMEGSISLNYLEIPVLGVFAVNKNINLFAGPYLDIYLNGKAKQEWEIHSRYLDPSTNEWETEDESGSDSEDIKSDDINSPGFGLLFGAEYLIGKISIGARYSIGLSTIPDEEDTDIKHKVIQFLVAFHLP
jgi:hypothetical protein